MKQIIAILSCFLLTACAPMEKRGGTLTASLDGHRFIEKEYENLSPLVEFILVKNQEEYERIFKEKFGANWSNISAFTLWNPKVGKCKIYIKDPLWRYEPELIGHEVAHCIWGRWHRGKEGLGDAI